MAAQPQLCAVCLDAADTDGEDGGQGVRTLVCGHRFHEDCIQVWLSEKGCCPLCRVPCHCRVI